MGDEHHAAAPALQERFEPIDGFDVEVVGRFVQQQHVGAGHQRTGQQHAALHAAGQAAELGVAVEVELGDGTRPATGPVRPGRRRRRRTPNRRRRAALPAPGG
ncbi:hypothetical protein G6F35_017566 [Rhizopus arrhizus]|nr:hypothetical protein G6F35_017566 [Rhizopus arrhizus]